MYDGLKNNTLYNIRNILSFRVPIRPSNCSILGDRIRRVESEVVRSVVPLIVLASYSVAPSILLHYDVQRCSILTR